jgi:hypothetical protein
MSAEDIQQERNKANDRDGRMSRRGETAGGRVKLMVLLRVVLMAVLKALI